MRGWGPSHVSTLGLVSSDSLVPAQHPIRRVKQHVDETSTSTFLPAAVRCRALGLVYRTVIAASSSARSAGNRR